VTVWAKNCDRKKHSGRKGLLDVVNDADVFLKNLLRLKGDVKAIGRDIELAYGARVKVVRIVEKRESTRSTRESLEPAFARVFTNDDTIAKQWPA
jgi:hypothetical protein